MPRETSSDEAIDKAWVHSAPIHNAPITLADYDPEWPRMFERDAARIRSVLGGKVLRLEHVGSTSVPGLPAKPIIDMLLVLADTADESGYVPALENAGYQLVIREPEWHEHRVFKGPDTNVNLHVFPDGSTEIDRMLRFRDRLRSDDAARDLYANTKRELAARTWKYVQNYADAKSEVVEQILAQGL